MFSSFGGKTVVSRVFGSMLVMIGCRHVMQNRPLATSVIVPVSWNVSFFFV